jgi:hypothetical protein
MRWGAFAAAEPELASFGADRLAARPSYLATIRPDGWPRVHPVTPVVTGDGLYVFMEPASPKGRDLRERGRFGLHTGVPDNDGSGGEFSARGTGRPVDDRPTRDVVARAASYEPEDRYVLFELELDEARCIGYGDVALPHRRRWREPRDLDRSGVARRRPDVSPDAHTVD